MPPPRMHADEADIDEPLVRRLLAAQFPQWAGLPVRPVASAGTDHAIYRLGDRLVARLPRIQGPVAQAEKERVWTSAGWPWATRPATWWSRFFSGTSRRAFRAALQVDDATWARGRGHALSQAAIFIPYYLHTNPVGVTSFRRMLDEVLADHAGSAA
jgi:aminoglycoside phosphotransferase (APT) family kinase protein